MSLQLYDGIQQLQEECIRFPAFDTAYEQIETNLKLFRATGVAQNLLIFGESGAGKSSLADLFANEYPMVELPERNLVPVLKVEVPAAATIAGTVEAVLAKLGDLQPERGTVSVKTARAVKIARSCGVEMLIFDEAQHIQDRGKAHSQYFVGDWLKSFMDALGAPVTLVGLPRTQILLQVNEQLRRRFMHRISLTMQQGADSNEADSLRLFTSLASILPLPLDPRPYQWGELARRLYLATDGRVAYVKKILIGAYSRAALECSDNISINDLSYAFTTTVWPSGVGALNPFHPSFIFRPLDRVGEPFQTAEMSGSTTARTKR